MRGENGGRLAVFFPGEDIYRGTYLQGQGVWGESHAGGGDCPRAGTPGAVLAPIDSSRDGWGYQAAPGNQDEAYPEV